MNRPANIKLGSNHFRMIAAGVLAICIWISSCGHKQVSPQAPASSTSSAQSHAAPTSTLNLSYIPENIAAAQKSHTADNSKSHIQLDEKSRAKVGDAFKAVILDDDKKAKTAFGRSYKFMPEFVQFAFDLRFKNFDHALELLPKLPYSAEEKSFWAGILKKRPIAFAKTLCEQFKADKFQMNTPEIMPDELAWSQEYYGVMNSLLKEEQSKATAKAPTPLNITLGKMKFKDQNLNSLPLDEASQNIVYNEGFFDGLRNAQRRDTRFWLDSYKNALKAWMYQRGYLPLYVYDLYSSMNITNTPQKDHFMKRLRGIIKDMRVESLLSRNRGDMTIGDEKDLAKVKMISKFMNRYPFVSVLLYFEPSLSGCDLDSRN